jgi:hypothetical protein
MQQHAKINVRINNLKFDIVIKEMIIYRPPAISKNNYFGFNSACYLTVWGFHRAHDIEVIHNRFCRFVLKIGKNVPTAFLYGELGHLL